MSLDAVEEAPSQALGLEEKLPKSKKISMSNWSRAPLSSSQLSYAARDAWCGYAVFDALATPEVRAHAADIVADELAPKRLEANASERRVAKRAHKALLFAVEGRRAEDHEFAEITRLRHVLKRTRAPDARLDLELDVWG